MSDQQKKCTCGKDRPWWAHHRLCPVYNLSPDQQAWLDSVSIIAAIGSYQEVEDSVILEADIRIVDSISQVLHRGSLHTLVEAGKLCRDDIYSEIGDIISGKKKYQYDSAKKVLYIPIGMGSEDIAVAYQVWQEAASVGLGTNVDLESYCSVL